jgi:hypothetical protein
MARCEVRFLTGSTTKRQTNGSAVHHLVQRIIGQWTHSLGNGPGFDLFPSVWRSVDWQSARKAPAQLISVPAHQFIVTLSAVLSTTHICCTTVVTILTTCFHIQKSCILPPTVCVCVCVCVCCMIAGINKNNECSPKQHKPISLSNGNSLFSVRYELNVQLLDTARLHSPCALQDELAKPGNLPQWRSLYPSLVPPLSSLSYVTGSI